jgi:Na+-driven multidrug efflux pump
MRLLAVGYIAFAVTQTLQGIMRGCGETVVPMWISIIVTVIIRMPLAYLWAHLTKSPAYPNGDPTCLYGSLLIAWCSGCALTTLFYIKGKWRKRTKKALTETNEENEPDATVRPA